MMIDPTTFERRLIERILTNEHAQKAPTIAVLAVATQATEVLRELQNYGLRAEGPDAGPGPFGDGPRAGHRLS
jgi:hypothetical protein